MYREWCLDCSGLY